MMLKRISLMASIFFFLIGTTVFAHSHLEGSSPKNGEVLSKALHDIKLTFETNLEETSTFSLKDKNGAVVPLSKVTVKGNRLIGTLNRELSNGAYTIHWKVIGIDGHPLEGDIPFKVQLPAAAQAASTVTSQNTVKSNQQTPVKAEKKGITTAASTAMPEANVTQQDSIGVKNLILPGVIVVFIVFGIGSYWLIYRRKSV